MRAMRLNTTGSLDENPEQLSLADLPVPKPGEGEVLLRVAACGVCHTELDEIEGRTPPLSLPVVLGHQVVGKVVEVGGGCEKLRAGDRVGVGWIYSSCQVCEYCKSGRENLCTEFAATGRDVDGGYAEYMCAKEDFAFPIPYGFSDIEAAPLLCAGAIGYRSLNLTGLENGQALGLTGFGGSGHLVLKMTRHIFPDSLVYVFARSPRERAFALDLGAVWVGDTQEQSPKQAHAIIDTTPAWKPMVEALKNLRPGGRLVINAIRKEDFDKDNLMRLDYTTHLWMEKEIKSVANVSRSDISEFLTLAAEMRIKPDVQIYPLEHANKALSELKQRKIHGAKVLRID